MKYIYNGVLTKDVAGWVSNLLQTYPYVLELAHMPDHEAFEKLYEDMNYHSEGEDCMGQSNTYFRKGIPYAHVRKEVNDSPTCFLFFPSLETVERFKKRFPILIINENPFSTCFE